MTKKENNNVKFSCLNGNLPINMVRACTEIYF